MSNQQLTELKSTESVTSYEDNSGSTTDVIGAGGVGVVGGGGGRQGRSDTLDRSSTLSMMEHLAMKKEVLIKHETKVSQVKPSGRSVSEWEWNIDKFDKMFPLGSASSLSTDAVGTTKVLKSKKFVAGTDIGRKSEWRFVMAETNGQLNWYLELCKIHAKGQSVIHSAFTMGIVDVKGRDLVDKNRSFQDFFENNQYGWVDLIDVERLYHEKDTFLADNTLRIRVLFEIFVDAVQQESESERQERENFAKVMTNDMNRLRTATGTADVHLESGGVVFPGHKLILAARSPAFARMFESSLQHFGNWQHPECASASSASGDNPPDVESLVAKVPVNDIEPKIMEIILDYLYSGNVKALSNPDVLTGVIRAADKLELRDLKAHCFNSLMNFISEENFGQIAVLAYRHNAERSVRMNINGYFLRKLPTLMSKKAFREALRAEPDAFWLAEEDCSSS